MRDGIEAEYADRLALELNVLDGCKVHGVDVLGALSAVGLKLVLDDAGDASVAYEEAVTD